MIDLRYMMLMGVLLACGCGGAATEQTVPDQNSGVDQTEKVKKVSHLDAEEAAHEVSVVAVIEKLDGQVTREGGAVVSVDLKECAAGDDDLKLMSSLTRLKELKVWGANVSDQGIAELVHLKSLVSLGLENTEVTDEGLKVVGTMLGLRSLNLRRCSNVTNDGLAHLGTLENLEQLPM